jgi:hypothetical protein
MSLIYKSDDELVKYYQSRQNYRIPETPIPKRTIYYVIDNFLASGGEGGFYTSLLFNFPIDFIRTNRPKFVYIKNAKYYHFDTETPPSLQVFVCSDIIQSEKYADSFLCTCNDAQQYKSLQIYDAKTEFSMWMKSERGSLLYVNKEICRIFLELLLEF